jgi:HrpA-like RNA helicase
MAPPAHRNKDMAAASPRRSARLLAMQSKTPAHPAASSNAPDKPRRKPRPCRRRAPPLPFRRRDSQACLAEHVARQQVVFAHSWPGVGKSSQVPRVLHAAGHGRVVCSQTYSLAARAAVDMRAGEVSYSVDISDNDDSASAAGKAVTYTTHHALLRALASDPLLARYGAVVVCDADDGMTLTAAVLSRVKAAAARRPDLRVVVFTRGTQMFDHEVAVNGFFPVAEHLHFHTDLGLCPWKFLPEPVTDYVAAAVGTVCRVHANEPPGDVLVFLPRVKDIEAAERALVSRALPRLVIRCLHEGLPVGDLIDSGVLILTPAEERKVVLATDIAGSAVFVEGIKYIVDSGYSSTDNAPLSVTTAATSSEPRMIQALKPAVISRYHVKRRPTRGKCFYLYTVKEMREMTNSLTLGDDVDRVATIVLILKDLGIVGGEVESFDFVLPPPRPETSRRALVATEPHG